MTDERFADPFAVSSADEMQIAAAVHLLNRGGAVAPRGSPTRELLGVQFRLREPRCRCTTLRARRWSMPLALGELAWHMRGSDRVSELTYYSPSWAAFASPRGQIAGSCYGRKIIGASSQDSELLTVIELLRTDPFSRRAVLSFWDRGVELAGAIDVACACTLQFIVRDARLHAFCYMRSNDLVYGLPYDVFLFTMLQEYVAASLGVQLGEYWHFAASLHFYERHEALVASLVTDPAPVRSPMPQMDSPEQILEFARVEAEIRNSGSRPRYTRRRLSPYWKSLAAVLTEYREQKLQRIPQATVNRTPSPPVRTRSRDHS